MDAGAGVVLNGSCPLDRRLTVSTLAPREKCRCKAIDARTGSVENKRMKPSSSAGSGSSASDFGLLALRVWLGISLFLKHGVEKIVHFSRMSAHFPDPVHLGGHTSLIIAMISDSICSLLVALGLGTRIAAFIIFMNLGVAFCLVHHYAFHTDHGELIIAYMGGFLALIFTGAGRFSLDNKFGRG